MTYQYRLKPYTLFFRVSLAKIPRMSKILLDFRQTPLSSLHWKPNGEKNPVTQGKFVKTFGFPIETPNLTSFSGSLALSGNSISAGKTGWRGTTGVGRQGDLQGQYWAEPGEIGEGGNDVQYKTNYDF